MTIHVVSWNVQGKGTAVLDELLRESKPDILALQEVKNGRANEFREWLAVAGLPNSFHSEEPNGKRYGNLLASRHPLNPVRPATKEFIWPQLIAMAEIVLDGHAVTVITIHAPNGVGNGWEKINCFRAAAELVKQRKGNPIILTGDFNEPQYFLQDDRIVTFGYEKTKSANGRYELWDVWKGGTGNDWDAPIRWFFEGENEHGLRHAFWDAQGKTALATTHVTLGDPRWFDHLFVSSHFKVKSCDYDHSLRERKISDHSAMRASLEWA